MSIWAKQEIDFLNENYLTMTLKEIGEKLRRSPRSVDYKLLLLGLNKNNPIKIGEKFGKFTVIKESTKRSAGGDKYFLCECYCGNFKEIIGGNLRHGNNKSCGCFSSLRKEAGVASWNALFLSYKKNARNKKLSFHLSIEDFIKISSMQCEYCGSNPIKFNAYTNSDGFTRQGINATKKSVDRSWIKKNGIDRIDSYIGYELNNCVPCCTDCNTMKLNKNVDYFLNHINKIAYFQNTKEKK